MDKSSYDSYAENTKLTRQDHRAMEYFHVKIKSHIFHNPLVNKEKKGLRRFFFKRILILMKNLANYAVVL